MVLSAFTSLHGHDEAWEALPKNSHLTLMMPRVGRHTWVPQRPWLIMAASTPRKTPASRSLTLPAPPSSAGGADDLDAPREGKGAESGRDGRAGPRACGGNDVVAAGVSDVGEGIVLGHDGDGRSGRLAVDGGAEGGGQPAYAALHAGAVLFRERGEPPRRLLLVEAEFRSRVDLVRDLLEIVGEAVQRLRDLGLGLVERFSGHAGLPARRDDRSSIAARPRPVHRWAGRAGAASR